MRPPRRRASKRSGSLFAFRAVLVLGLCLLGRAARAQNSVAPAAHWGMVTYPEEQQTQQIGLQHFLFTEFGKPGDGRYGDFSDMESMGFTFLTFSNTRVLKRDGDVVSNVLYASTVQVGYTGHQPGFFFQNDVQHNLSNYAFVPRGRERTFPDLGYDGEVAYWFLRSAINQHGERVMVPTPFFVSGGLGVSTVMVDGYTAVGVRHLEGPYLFGPKIRRWIYLSFSAMARLGVPITSCQFGWTRCAFPTVAPYYVVNQISVTGHFIEHWFPVRLEIGYTGDSGLFLDKLRRPMPERFWTVRVGLGDFTFEIANDSFGDKDIGPTFAARFFVNLSPGTPFLGWLLNKL